MLKFLHKSLGAKLFYMGLPSIEALDIKEWLEYLEVIYAFQCRDYPNASHPSQNRDAIDALDNYLMELERGKKIKTFEVFDGWIEEVILKGKDNSPKSKEFKHEDVVTIYNLDYCNSITSPITFIDKDGNSQTAYKFEAIKRLLDMQAHLKIPSKKFILFLTIHCSYNGQELGNFINSPPSQLKKFIGSLAGLSKSNKAPHVLKAFVSYTLSNYFLSNNFIPEFLPVIYYKGTGDHKLLHFTIIGTEVKGAGSLTPFQNIEDFLNMKFKGVSTQNEFTNIDLHRSDDTNWSQSNPLTLFQTSKTYTKIWQTAISKKTKAKQQ